VAAFRRRTAQPQRLDWNPWTGEIWTTVNERDQLGSDLVPDYLTNVPVGAQYGWPWLYWGKNIDERVRHRCPISSVNIQEAVYAMGPHVAALGWPSRAGNRMGPAFGQGAFVARHGSWNRKPPAATTWCSSISTIAQSHRQAVPVLTDFLNKDGTTKGRPTWVAWDKTGRCCERRYRRDHLARDRARCAGQSRTHAAEGRAAAVI